MTTQSERLAEVVRLLKYDLMDRFSTRQPDWGGPSVWRCIECNGDSAPGATVFDVEHILPMPDGSMDCSTRRVAAFLHALDAAPAEPEPEICPDCGGKGYVWVRTGPTDADQEPCDTCGAGTR